MVGDGAQAAGDLPPDLGDLLGEEAARVHGLPPPQAGWEVEVLLPSPSRLCSSGTNSDRLSTRPFQSQAVQWEAIPLLVERNMVTGLLVTGQTGGPHSQAVPGYTTRRRAFRKRFDPLRQNIIIIRMIIPKKALGLGVAAGFVGGAALGAAGTMATYSVYHRCVEIIIVYSRARF